MKYQIKYENGIANRGNLTRLKEVMERATRGETLTIGFIGGSITQGSLATAPERCYAYRVYRWWCENFPKADFTYANAGIGGTTSQFGVARVEEDLLTKEPDFVIIEFSVNDESTAHFMETYEGLVRRVYGDKRAPAVLLVHNVYYHSGANAQLMHGRIGRHYDLPAVSMQSTIFPEVVAGRIKNEDITPDDLHPNDEGHAMVASVITYFLEQVKQETTGTVLWNPLPEPLTANAYEDSMRLRNTDTTPILNGFTADMTEQKDITDCFKHGWTATEEGASIRFFVEGSCIAVQYRKSVKKPAPIAVAVVDKDEAHAVTLDANFEEDWGDKLELATILEHGVIKKHQVEIRLLKVPKENVVPFYLVSVIGSGRFSGADLEKGLELPE